MTILPKTKETRGGVGPIPPDVLDPSEGLRRRSLSVHASKNLKQRLLPLVWRNEKGLETSLLGVLYARYYCSVVYAV